MTDFVGNKPTQTSPLVGIGILSQAKTFRSYQLSNNITSNSQLENGE